MNHTVDMINSVMRRKVKSEFWRVLSSPEEDNRDQPQVRNKTFVHLVLFLHDQLTLEKKKKKHAIKRIEEIARARTWSKFLFNLIFN